MSVFERVYRVVRQIPAGEVSTYGAIAKLVGTTPRVVGFALHSLRFAPLVSSRGKQGKPKVPCHRVVDRNGRLAPNFAFGGAREQYLRLKSEGIEFLEGTYVDLDKHTYAHKRNS